jgi:uncharacterized caspase-like protein
MRCWLWRPALVTGVLLLLPATGRTQSVDVERPPLYLLAVGISKYPERKLDYAAADAAAVAAAFEKHSKAVFQSIEVKVVTDDKADRKGILDGMEWLRKHMTAKAMGIVYFAGRGVQDKEGALCLLPVDFKEKGLAGSALTAKVLKEQLAGIPSRLLLILDASHAGAFLNAKKAGKADPAADPTGEDRLVVLAAATASEEARESNEHRHGVFTQALVEGLAGKAEKDSSGAVYLHELDRYITNRVKELSKGRQHPVLGKPTSIRSFPVSKP